MGIKTIAGASALLLTLPFPLLANDIYVGAKAGWVHGNNTPKSEKKSSKSSFCDESINSKIRYRLHSISPLKNQSIQPKVTIKNERREL